MRRLPVFVIAAGLLAGAGWTAGQAMAQETKGKGVGPVKEVTLGPIDAQMAQAGRKTFDAKCALCHLLDGKKMGPPLRDVTQQRAPEWIMNMLLNASEMLASDPEASKLAAQFPLRMPNQQLKQDDARQILEYLRQVAQEKPAK
jgi:mono/diheme cytochrome c family protein